VTLQTVEGLPEGGQHVPPPPVNHAMVDMAINIKELDTAHNKFSLHLDDPGNFLRLSAALRLLVHHQLTNTHIDHAEQLIWEYCTELLLVSLLTRT
jgi:hypothetical protein